MDRVLNMARRLYRQLFPADPVGEHIKRGLVVGKNFSMLDEVIIDYSHTWLITIGDDVTLGFQYEDQNITISTKSLDRGWKTVTWSDSEIKPILQANGISYTDLEDKYFKFVFNIKGVP